MKGGDHLSHPFVTEGGGSDGLCNSAERDKETNKRSVPRRFGFDLRGTLVFLPEGETPTDIVISRRYFVAGAAAAPSAVFTESDADTGCAGVNSSAGTLSMAVPLKTSTFLPSSRSVIISPSIL